MRIWANRLYPRILTVTEETAEGMRLFAAPRGETNINQNIVNRLHEEKNTSSVSRSESMEEARNLYRTEVYVEVVNHNEIRDAKDMEALADRFAEGLREKLYAAVEGVYG